MTSVPHTAYILRQRVMNEFTTAYGSHIYKDLKLQQAIHYLKSYFKDLPTTHSGLKVKLVTKLDEKRSLWQITNNHSVEVVCEYQIYDDVLNEYAVLISTEEGGQRLQYIKFSQIDQGVKLTVVMQNKSPTDLVQTVTKQLDQIGKIKVTDNSSQLLEV